MNEETDWEKVLADLDLSVLDIEDESYVIVDYDAEKIEPKFRWEYAHESCTEFGSVFRKVISY